MWAVWQNVHSYSVYTEDQILARGETLALAFHIAVTLTQPGAEPKTRSSKCGWGNWSPHGEFKRNRLCVYSCVCVCVFVCSLHTDGTVPEREENRK